MPLVTEHSGRIRPKTFKFWSRSNNKGGPGVDFVFGSMTGKKGTWKLQAIRFDSKKFTPTQARAWMKSHGHKWILFEESKPKE
jgi:hypothetical protein